MLKTPNAARCLATAPLLQCRAQRLACRAMEEPSVATISRMKQYNEEMQERMGWKQVENPYSYDPDFGLYYHHVESDLIVGSQPQNAEDIQHLHEHEDVKVIYNMQQDKDMAYWSVDGEELQRAAAALGIEYVRVEAVDFDPHSLRRTLPQAVARLQQVRKMGRVYLHCTAGLGRSPAVAIASLFWHTDMNLEQAYEYLTSIRPCGPNKDAIRAATFDVLDDRHFSVFDSLPSEAFLYLSQQDREFIRNRLLGVDDWN